MQIFHLAIGTILLYNGVRLKVMKAVDGCRGCYFKWHKTACPQFIGACFKPWRDEDVIFRKVDVNKKENFHIRHGK